MRKASDPPSRRDTWLLIAVASLAVMALVLGWARSSRGAPGRPLAAKAKPKAKPKAVEPAVALPTVASLTVQEVQAAKRDGAGQLVAQVQGQAVPLTLDPTLQTDVQAMLDKTHVPYGAVVLLDPATGEVLAMAEHHQAGVPTGAIGALDRPAMPAASVFKVVTAAALLKAGQSPDSTACSHGGRQGIDASHLKPSRADRHCETLTRALAHSTNAIFARQAIDHLAADSDRKSTRLNSSH